MDRINETTIFNPSAGLFKGAGPTLVSTSFTKKVFYYTFPDGMTMRNREFLTFYLASLGSSEDRSLELWKTWVVTYVCAITPAFSKMLSTKMFQASQLSSVKILALTGLFEQLEEAIDNDDKVLAKSITSQISRLDIMDKLPKLKDDLDFSDANGEWNYKVILCHYSIMLFLAGKRVAGDDHSQITVSRPKAIKGKVHIDETVELLEGSLKMSNLAHVRINDAWSEMGPLRAIVFTEYSKFESAMADETQNIIWTTMHLLRFSGMSHAAIVFNFLQVCPWVYEIPTLRPALATYARSVVEAAKVDPKTFPYLKLIQGDKSNFFQRKDLEPLIACAVAVLTETTPTLAAYYTKPEFSPIVEAFNAKREEKERAGGKNIALEVPEGSFEDKDEESDGENVD